MKKINFKIYKQKRKQRISVSGISLQVDWFLILIIGIMLFVVGVGYAGWLYVRVNNGSLFEVVEDTNVEVELQKQKEKIKKTVDLILEEQKTFQVQNMNATSTLPQ